MIDGTAKDPLHRFQRGVSVLRFFSTSFGPHHVSWVPLTPSQWKSDGLYSVRGGGRTLISKARNFSKNIKLKQAILKTHPDIQSACALNSKLAVKAYLWFLKNESSKNSTPPIGCSEFGYFGGFISHNPIFWPTFFSQTFRGEYFKTFGFFWNGHFGSSIIMFMVILGTWFRA